MYTQLGVEDNELPTVARSHPEGSGCRPRARKRGAASDAAMSEGVTNDTRTKGPASASSRRASAPLTSEGVMMATQAVASAASSRARATASASALPTPSMTDVQVRQ